MKFLVDAQLPKNLSDFLIGRGFDSIHTIDLPHKNRTSDKGIIQFAETQNRIIISKDVDFLNSHLIKSLPSKLVIVKTGNISNRKLIEIFDSSLDLIIRMLKHSDLVEVNQKFIADRKK